MSKARTLQGPELVLGIAMLVTFPIAVLALASGAALAVLDLEPWRQIAFAVAAFCGVVCGCSLFALMFVASGYD